MKIYFTYDNNTKEEFTSKLPTVTSDIPTESVDEIIGDYVLEKVPDLIAFLDECYRILRPNGKITFNANHYASNKAWLSPITKRAISEVSLNFASKDWRDSVKYTETNPLCNFEVVGNFAIEQECVQRSEVARNFWMQKYLNVVQMVVFTLTKK